MILISKAQPQIQYIQQQPQAEVHVTHIYHEAPEEPAGII